MTYEAIQRDIRNKIFSPVYFLHGEEPYYIDKVSDLIENAVLDESEREFNQSVLYGRDTDLLTVIGSAKRFPMMANHQVIIIREAQDLKNLLPKRSKNEEEEETNDGTDEAAPNPLLSYLEKPLPSTILVFGCKYKKLPKNTKLFKAIEKKGVIFESVKLKDKQLSDWIVHLASEKSVKINLGAVMLLGEYLGSDLSKIANELDKILINLKPGEEISAAHIEKYTGISKDYNVFELGKALGIKDELKAFRNVKYFTDNKRSNPLVMTLGYLYGYFTKILKIAALSNKSPANIAAVLKGGAYYSHEYETAAKRYSLPKLIQIIADISECDLKLKGIDAGSADEGELLKELVYKILH